MANMSYLWLHEDTNETDSKSETPKVGKHISVRQDDFALGIVRDNCVPSTEPLHSPTDRKRPKFFENTKSRHFGNLSFYILI